MPETVFIYALCEPGSSIVRYVGMTTHMAKRLRAHVSGSRRHPSRLGNWLRDLMSENLRPALRLVMETSRASWRADEARCIRVARQLGYDLVNGNNGGGGQPHLSEVHRAKIRATLKGRRLSPQCLNAARRVLTGKKKTAGHRAKLSAAHTGVALSSAHRHALSVSHSGKKNPMFGKKIPASIIAKRTASRAARKAHVLS